MAEIETNVGNVILAFEDLSAAQKNDIRGASFEYKIENTTFYFKRTDETEWQSINLEGLDFKWNGTQLGVKNSSETRYTYTELRGETGYFTPSIDSEGNISWTNNGNLENPPTMNIKGVKGDVITNLVKVDKFENLPTTGKTGTIYIIPNSSTAKNNVADEYYWNDTTQEYEVFGVLNADIDSKADKTDLDALTTRVDTAETNITSVTGKVTTLENAGYITKDVDNLKNYTKTSDMTTAINDAVSPKANTADVYNKTEMDAKLSGVATSSNISSLSDRVTAVENNKANNSDVTTLTTQVNTNKTDIATNTSNITTNTSNITSLTPRVTSAENTIKNKVDTSTLGNYSTTSDVNTAIANALTGHAITEIVTSLPTSNIKTDIFYLVADGGSTEGNKYNVYLYINNAWEQVDAVKMDMASYPTTAEMNLAITTALADYYKKTETYSKTETDNAITTAVNAAVSELDAIIGGS